MNTSSNLFALSALTMACAMAMSGMAQAAEADQPKDQKVHQLQAVEIEETADENGKAVITADKLAMQPSSTGTVTDALRGQSFVQFDANSRNGAAGAEITPPEISIRGSRSYENAYMVNGVNNNNTFYTGHNDVAPGAIYHGDVQSVVLNTELLENITVLTENISAEYGDFTGGVVDAKIRDAHTDRWHVSFWTRHTRDSWSKQHLTESQIAEEHPSFDSGLQKEFKKSNVGVTLEGPLMDGKLGAMVSYQKTHSSTSTWSAFTSSKNNYYYEKKDSSRDLDNFLVRLNTDPVEDFYVSTSLMYSPYEAEYEPKTYRSGKFSHEGGGLNLVINTRANLSIGKWTNDLGISRTNAKRDSDSDIEWMWFRNPANGGPNWGSNPNASIASEGGQGDLDQEQDTVNFKSVLSLNSLTLGATEHKIRIGGEVQYKEVTADFSGRTVYNSMKLDSKVQGEKADGIWAGSQYAKKRWVYDAMERSESYVSGSLFAEDAISIERFQIRPGIRLSYDDVTSEMNIAPRFTFDADVLNDRRFKINAGYNRYYGSELLGLATRFNPVKNVESRKTASLDADNRPDDEWVRVPGVNKNHFEIGELDTPYSDEFVLGATANVADTIFHIQGVYRDYKNQLRYLTEKNAARETFSRLTNEGESEYKGITFSFVKSYDLGTFGRHTSQFGVTWSELESNSMRFNDLYEGENIVDVDAIYLDGKHIDVSELPATNFNSNWVITYTHDASFMDDRLRAAVLARWEDAADGLYRLVDGDVGYQPDRIDYKSVSRDNLFNVDMTLAYDLIKTENSILTVNMDILNLFDKKSLVDYDGKAGYSMGRQFYLGMSYEY